MSKDDPQPETHNLWRIRCVYSQGHEILELVEDRGDALELADSMYFDAKKTPKITLEKIKATYEVLSTEELNWDYLNE